jgi:hypothetical protein
MADQESQNFGFGKGLNADALSHFRSQYKRWLMMAQANYRKLADDLAERKSDAPLSPAEEAILRQADFAQAECQIDLGHYEEAIRLYEILTVRYSHRIEHLLALREIFRCYFMLRNPAKARETALEVRKVLSEVRDEDLPATAGQTRKDWQEWLNWAEKESR